MQIYRKNLNQLKFQKNSNKIRTILLIETNKEINKFIKNTKGFLNSELPSDFIKKFETFEVKLKNPTINSCINFKVGNESFRRKSNSSSGFLQNTNIFNQSPRMPFL